MPRPKKMSLMEETRSYFEQGGRMKASLEQKRAELLKEVEEIEQALTMFEDGPKLLPPIRSDVANDTSDQPPPEKRKEPDTEGAQRTPVAKQLLELRPFWDYLSTRHREIVGLRASGMMPEAIATKLQIEKKAVSMCIYIAKQNLLRKSREHTDKPSKPPHPSSDDEPEPARRRGEKKTTEASSPDRTVWAYFKDIHAHHPMTREEEHEIAVLYIETQDKKLEDKLVTANLRLVIKIANDYRKSKHNMIDMIQEGNLGLLHAVRKYDPNRGVKLSTYASWWIKAYILKFIVTNWSLVKIGTTQNQRKLFFNLKKEETKLEKDGVIPDNKTLAAALKVDEKTVREMQLRLNAPTSSLDVEDSPTARSASIDDSHRPDTLLAETEFKSILRSKLDEFRERLCGRDLDIFLRRLTSEDPVTLGTLAESFNVGRERVRQIETRLIRKLREFLLDEIDEDSIAASLD